MSDADPSLPGAPLERAVPVAARQTRVVTGGGSGIGEFIVEAFAAQGARVAFIDIQADASRALALPSRGPAARRALHPQDLTDIEGTQAAIAGLCADWGGMDILINNAANDDRHHIAEITREYWDERLAVESAALLLLCAVGAAGDEVGRQRRDRQRRLDLVAPRACPISPCTRPRRPESRD